jgi:hypothetical protein
MHIIEGKIEGGIQVTGRQRRRRKQLLDYLKETRGYWKFKVEALDRIAWKRALEEAMGLLQDTLS